MTKSKENWCFNLCGIKIKIRRKKYSKHEDTLINSAYEDNEQNKYIKTPKIKSLQDTLEDLIFYNRSICRFGDGEFNIIFGTDISFQNSSTELAERLKEILLSKNENIFIGILNIFKNLEMYEENNKNYWRKFVVHNRTKLYSLLDFNKQYYDAEISRPYIGFKDKTYSQEFFKKIKKLWNNREIIFVEGKYSRLGYNNDLFDNAKSIERILCPTKNAFDKYTTILNTCKNLPKNKLFIIALGPTATVLAYDLSNIGYQALDLGHLDIEYEWFLRGTKRKTAIKNKYVNETKKGRNPKLITDESYLKEILTDLS